jgi:signal transduction histidine kinase
MVRGRPMGGACRFRVLRERGEMTTTRNDTTGDRLERQAARRASSRLAVLGQFAATLAHQTRASLTVIRSTVQLLLAEAALSSPQQRLVEDLLEEVDRVNGTLHDLLDFIRPGDRELCTTDLVEPLAKALRLSQAKAAAQQVVFAPDLGERCLWVNANPGELTQLFVNLLLNALQAMPNGGSVTIKVRARGRQPRVAGGWAEVQIADTGVGISRAQLAKIFAPFYTTHREGAGLGLAICRTIVKRHGGRIQIASDEAKGTTVFVLLPLHRDQDG